MGYADPEDNRRYQREWYQKNKQAFKEKNDRARAERRQFVRDLKEATPCADCGKSYPHYVMDFDHLGDDKVREVARLVAQGTIRQVRAEVVKCEVVCSNCHRVRTHERRLTNPWW